MSDESGELRKCEIKTFNYIMKSWSVVSNKPSNVAALRQSYMTRLNNFETVLLPKKYRIFFCKYCHHPWSEGSFTLKVLPKPVLGKRIRKLLRKKMRAPSKLSQYQKNLIEFVEKDKGNKFVLTCLVCKKKTIKSMKEFRYDVPNEEFEKEEETSKTKKKKMKKKDVFAGLNRDIVLKSSSEYMRPSTSSTTYKESDLKSSLESKNNSIETSKKKIINCEASSLNEQNKNEMNICYQNRSVDIINIINKRKWNTLQQNLESKRQECLKKNKTKQLKKMLHGQLLVKPKEAKISDLNKLFRDFGRPADF